MLIVDELQNIQESNQEQNLKVSDLLGAIKKLLNYTSFRKVSSSALPAGGSLYSYVIDL